MLVCALLLRFEEESYSFYFWLHELMLFGLILRRFCKNASVFSQIGVLPNRSKFTVLYRFPRLHNRMLVVVLVVAVIVVVVVFSYVVCSRVE